MIKSKYILSFLLLINNSIGFIFPVKYNSIVCRTPQINNNMHIMHIMHMKNNDNEKNTSKIYKIVFSNEDEDELEQLYKPKYMFGLSEFNLIFIRIFVYYIITIYFIALIIQKNN
jgi:hypothetical protein